MKVNWSKDFTDDELRKLAAKLKPSKRANNRLAKRAEVRGWLDTLIKDALSVMDAPRQRVNDKSPGRLGDGTPCEEAVMVGSMEEDTRAATPKTRKKAGWKCGCGKWTTEPIARRCAECKASNGR